MRKRLIGLLVDANDPAAEAKWLNDRGSFDDWFNDLDWLASEDLSEPVGVLLSDEREATAVGTVRERVNAMFEELSDAEFETYLSDARWLGVQEAARQALAVMEEPS
jgi:hypothetical protein